MPRRRQRRSFGSITEVTKGRKYVCRWVENTERGRVRRSRTVIGTYREAERFLSMKNVEVGAERRVPTLNEAYELWYVPHLARRVESGRLRAETVDDRKRLWANTVAPKFGASCIDKVDALSLQKWLMTLAPSTASIALSMMRGVAAVAARYVDLPRNPLARSIEYELPTKKAWTKSTDTYDLDTARRVMAALHGNDMLEAPYILAAFGGARVTEAAAVKWHEVKRIESGGATMAVLPIVRHTRDKGHDTTDDGLLKNQQSVRFTIVPEPYCFRLFEIAAERERDGIEWMCDRGDGLPLNGQMLKYYWNQFIKKSDVPCIPFSNLRKSWRTYIDTDYKLPWNVAEVLMGHKLPGVTGKHYFKLTEGQAVSIMGEAVGRVKDI